MNHAYLPVTEISRRLNMDYYNTRKILVRLSEENIVQKVDGRYEYNSLVTQHLNRKDWSDDALTETRWVTIQEAHQIITDRNIQMHVKTVGRKIKEGVIPAIIFENEKRNLYRVPATILEKIISEGQI